MRIDPLYILPNLFTGASIYLGILAISYALAGRFEPACWLVLVSLIFDGLDGRVARLTGTTSKFGVEFDSLADVIAFGAAPALILFIYAGQSYGKLGVLVCGIYVVLGAVRLARFNVTTANNDPNVFIGLPIPAAAVFVVSWLLFEIYLARDFPVHAMSHSATILSILLAATFATALLMVSNIRYPSFKKLNIRASFKKIIVTLMLLLAVLFLYPLYTIVVLITIYVCFGPLRACYYLITRRKLN